MHSLSLRISSIAIINFIHLFLPCKEIIKTSPPSIAYIIHTIKLNTYLVL